MRVDGRGQLGQVRRRLRADDDGVEGGEPDRYDAMEREELVDECLARGLPSDGNRKRLRARLRLQDVVRKRSVYALR